MSMRRLLLAGFALVMCIWCVPMAHAIAEARPGSPAAKINYPWGAGAGDWHEQEMFDAGVKGWFLPVGPTGIRAQITHENPNYFTVKYVFTNSPAGGKVKAGDIIVGANGVELKKPHVFGRDSKSWEGPLTEMAKLIEDSQGKDGSLELMVWPGGAKDKLTKVMIQIKPVGRFSSTYPFNCPRSEKLVTDLCAYLADELASKYGRPKMGGFAGHHVTLAFMASGESKYDTIVKEYVTRHLNHNPDPNGSGKQCWDAGYLGIIIGEYYRRTQDTNCIPVLNNLSRFYLVSQDPSVGSTSHATWPGIQRRMAAGGPPGYGQMSAPGALAMGAMSILKACGLEYSEEAFQRTHQAYLRGVRPDRVEIGYNFANRSFAIITLEDGNQARSPMGCGYRVPTGMKEITRYTAVYPSTNWQGGHVWIYNYELQKAKDLGKDLFWWIEAERDSNEVYDMTYEVPDRYGSKNVRMVVRREILPEPTKPYNTVAATGVRVFPRVATGLGALAHLIGNTDTNSWGYLGKHAANTCAVSAGNWFDGHAAGTMHQLWVGLGASMADPDKYRQFMDEVKWWFVMMQTHDGSYFLCPNRDRPSGCNTDPKFGPHILPSANAALILSVPRKQLLITGADPKSSPVSGADKQKHMERE